MVKKGLASKIYTENVINGQCFTNNDCPKSYCNLAHPDEPGMCHGKVVPTGKILIPLRGIAVGDGWIDPINMVGGYPDMVRGFFFCFKVRFFCFQGKNVNSRNPLFYMKLLVKTELAQNFH